MTPERDHPDMGWSAFLRRKSPTRGKRLTRLEADARFASIRPEDWFRLSLDACRIAVSESGLDDERLPDALRALEREVLDAEAAASMRTLSDSLDQEAWKAEEVGDDRCDVLFRRSRAASALAFALTGEPGEAIFEAAFALPCPGDLVRRLPT
jgi:hypothetical protein